MIKGIEKLAKYVDDGYGVEDGCAVRTICQKNSNVILVAFENGSEFEIKGDNLEVVSISKIPQGQY
jgi:hypothetical protein